ncbi:sugar fermentation stimulation protein A [Lysinibacillus composti]|uniref:Sugar fermentation stimulation protein homolog n=1 Tax=Lysinibacillus composti TaxID=720633 RepID=A0A3N9UCL8_9BACI|nr:DNA/RNA nuclease SfsA [Lysinibacillus composti]MBM7609093.1 sugar fermentation stimulation protein A [Lysinibacillus composti]RQW74153.1 DNA/RNA nuclease SfsA [Lysinibacillus composti]
MKYEKIVHGQFDQRINRFIAEVTIDGGKERVHVKNTGRLKELFLPGADVLLEETNNPNRKTKYSLTAVMKQGRWVNIDSQAPNKVAFEAVRNGKIAEIGEVTAIKREVTYGASRFDLYFEQGDQKGFIEVKGVTLEKEGIAMFPDAPTTRGTKHVLELAKAVEEGYKCAILLVVQLKGCQEFVPNRETDPAFADALLQASEAGVQILAYDSVVTEDGLVLDQAIPVNLV